ncbi:MAG: ATP-dependent nuclease subunit B [Ignavibacteria bacterium]|nr:MAG: ATP-dependent nuclease subunit B [Ignavibacteria bacterium]KAF0160071.1 MAG: ATP-dependent nuclease subunit B [Ignavibacteria bacterium]
MILTKENIRSVDIDEIVNSKISTGSVSEILFLVPTNRRARTLKKELISLMPNSAAYQIKVETLNTISSKLLNEVKPFRQISEAASSVFIRQICAKTKFRYLSLYRDEIPAGTLDKIRNVIVEYKRHGIAPETLIAESDKLTGSERNKALDIADVYKAYLEKCLYLRAFDYGDVYSELNTASNTDFAARFTTVYGIADYIIIDGFSEFSNPEVEIIYKLSNAAKLFIAFDYNADNDFLFAHLEKTVEVLNRFGFSEIKDLRAPDMNEFHSFIREKLFKVRSPKQKKKLPIPPVVLHGTTKEREVELLAKQIKTILLEGRTEPHKICVTFNLVQDYSSIVKDIFAKFGLPFNLTDRTLLQNSAPVIALINFLETVENDYYFKNIFRALNSGFIELAEIDSANLYRVSSEHKIVSGKENWINNINIALANLSHIGDEDDLSVSKTKLENAKKDIQKLFLFLEPFEVKMTVNEFRKKLSSFIVDSKLVFTALNYGVEKEKNVRAVAQLLNVTNEIFELMEEEFAAEKKFPLSYFVEQLRTACGWARFNVKEKSDYGVLVTSLDEIRGLQFDYLFIGGLCDGILPTRFNPEIFFSGSYKKQAFIHQTEERYLFYRALCSWKKKLFLSYHQSNESKETVTSSFLKDFTALVHIEEINSDVFTDSIFSQEELLIEVGKNLSSELRFALEEYTVNKMSDSLEVEKKRNTSPFGGSSFTGDVLNEDDLTITKNELEEIENELKKLAYKQYSISQLENYAKCPFKYFAERVLGIEPIEEPTEDIEAIEMGRLLHSILFEFYTDLRKKKIVLQQCSNSDFEKAKELIFEIAERELESTAFKSPLTFYEKEKILGIGGSEEESVLFRFIENERNSDKDFVPQFFEVGFGRLRSEESDGELTTTEAIAVDDINLRGKIDRIEINEEGNSFNIVDYKLSGTKPTYKDFKNGVSLQLPVYLYASAKLLSKKFNRTFTPNEMFIYSLKYNQEEFGKTKVSLGRIKDAKFNSVDELIQNSLSYIKNYVERILQGKFNLSILEDRENKVCRFCQFRLVCRIDDITSNYAGSR